MRLANPFLHAIDRFYSLLIKLGNNLQSLFLLYMRVTWSHQLILYGLKKLSDIDQTSQYFASLNIAQPHFSTYLVGLIELLGGICLFVGFASRLACIPIMIVLLTALSTAHAPEIANLRFLSEPLSLVVQAPYPFLITTLLIFIFGPGRFSIDAWLKRWSQQRPKY